MNGWLSVRAGGCSQRHVQFAGGTDAASRRDACPRVPTRRAVLRRVYSVDTGAALVRLTPRRLVTFFSRCWISLYSKLSLP